MFDSKLLVCLLTMCRNYRFVFEIIAYLVIHGYVKEERVEVTIKRNFEFYDQYPFFGI